MAGQCPITFRFPCIRAESGQAGLTLPQLGSLMPTTPLRDILFVNPDTTSPSPNGSITAPYATIQAALDAIGPGTSRAEKQRQKTVLIAPGFYDENLNVQAVGRYIALIGLGPWVLGDGKGNFPCVSTVQRNITVTIDDDNDQATTANRSGLALGCINWGGEMSSTFTALATGALISGDVNVNVISNNRLHEFHIFAAKICGDLDFGTVAEFDFYTYKSYFDQTFTGTRSNLVICHSTQFDGLVQCKTWNRFTECEFRAGFTAGAANDPANDGALPPSGMFNCDFSGTYTSLHGAGADPFPLDAATNFIFKANGAAVANATKSILADLVA